MNDLNSLVLKIGNETYTLRVNMQCEPMEVAFAQTGDKIDIFKRSLPEEWRNLDDKSIELEASQLQQTTVSFDTCIRDAGLTINDDGTYHFEYGGGAEDLIHADSALAETIISPRLVKKPKRHRRGG